MAFIFSRIDKNKESQGVWVDHPDGSRHLLARSGSVHQQRAYNDMLKRYRKRDHDELPLDKRTEFFCHVIANAVVLGWENLTDLEGTPVPYSEENAFQYLMDSPEYLEWVQNESAIESRYYREKVESAKNN